MNVQLEITAEKKHAIFDSTLRLIKEHGFHGTPMSQIAQDAGVSIGTIYHYFSSKDELIFELFNHCKKAIKRAVFREDELSLPYPDRFAAIWMNLVNHHITHPEVLSFLEQFFSSPYAKAIYSEECRVHFQDEMSIFLNQGVEAGLIKKLDLNIISAAFIGTVSAAAKRHISGHFSFSEADMKSMVGIVWDGIKN